jgi:FtsH-binding integral membrane protein
MGLVCVVIEWVEIDDKQARFRLMWTQALHWAAVLVRMNIMLSHGAYISRVYNHMAAGVGLTGLVAMLTYQFTGPALLQSPLMWVFMLAPVALVFLISSRINTLSAKAARRLFFIYAASAGLSLSTIFHVYTGSSITRVFFISAATFGAPRISGVTPPSATCRD